MIRQSVFISVETPWTPDGGKIKALEHRHPSLIGLFFIKMQPVGSDTTSNSRRFNPGIRLFPANLKKMGRLPAVLEADPERHMAAAQCRVRSMHKSPRRAKLL